MVVVDIYYMSNISKQDFKNFFKYYKSEEQQEAGVGILYDQMRDVLKDDAHDWITTYRSKPEVPKGSNPLTVPYDCQLNNPGGDGWRECFSSSCAMAAMFWGVIKNPNEYHAVRPRYGDSTDASAQIRTLQSFGLDARFVQVGSVAKLKAQIDRGRPAPVGFLHHGSSSAPSGGGHYICAIGYTDTHLIAHDPYGELDVLNGGYPKTGGTYGKEIKYSWKHWAPRWSVSNDHDGWGLDIVKA
tara:strand:+ start:515 stop:1240 length:726 start_codon:yes stop_codon:yes gene_type:complete